MWFCFMYAQDQSERRFGWQHKKFPRRKTLLEKKIWKVGALKRMVKNVTKWSFQFYIFPSISHQCVFKEVLLVFSRVKIKSENGKVQMKKLRIKTNFYVETFL